ncbi:MAG: DUF4911 domain-containing protein [Thermodesulfobacteriota bacterium]
MRRETARYVFRVNRKDIAYLRGTVESYDGMAVVRTLDPSVALIEMRVSPGCETTLLELVDDLVRSEALPLELIPGQDEMSAERDARRGTEDLT